MDATSDLLPSGYLRASGSKMVDAAGQRGRLMGVNWYGFDCTGMVDGHKPGDVTAVQQYADVNSDNPQGNWFSFLVQYIEDRELSWCYWALNGTQSVGYTPRCNTTLMAWETRRRGGQYYTRSVRVDGVVHRRYLGKDDLAYLVAAFDEDDQRTREAIAQAWREEQAAALELEAPLIEFNASLDLLTANILTAAGFHRHNFGKWRKKRDTNENNPPPDRASSGPNLDQGTPNAGGGR